jgi:hypothetical protein
MSSFSKHTRKSKGRLGKTGMTSLYNSVDRSNKNLPESQVVAMENAINQKVDLNFLIR